jgi:DivIVA domain-containing protein
MAIAHEFTGWASIGCGAAVMAFALARVRRMRLNEARSAAIPAVLWVALPAVSWFLATGVLSLRYPHYPRGTWLSWVPIALSATALVVLVAHSIVSPSRPRPQPLPLNLADVHGPDPVATLDAGTAALIERIRKVQFSTTRLAPGYDEEEVDDFLDKLVKTLGEGGPLSRSQLRDTMFSTTRLRPGYTMADVDAFLAEVAQAI